MKIAPLGLGFLISMSACTLAYDKDDFEFRSDAAQEESDAGQPDVGRPDAGECSIASDCPRLPNATMVCNAGRCELGGCARAFEDCDGEPENGCELDTNSDPSNCGGCGVLCDRPNATTSCISGSCVITACDDNFENCDNSGTNGCEADLTRPDTCGGCSIRCASDMLCSTTGEIPRCVDGCDDGEDICSMMCVVLDTNADHCGGCGVVCPDYENGTRTCVDRRCGGECDVGFVDCNDDDSDGCEIDITSDVNNCNGCDMRCTPGDNVRTAACDVSTCVVGTCETGFADCNSSDGDGCEINTTSDVRHCGGCDLPCELDNVAAQDCVASSCEINACNPGFEDCNDDDSDGCEIDLQTDSMNCGRCGKVCANSCNAGICDDDIVEVSPGARVMCARQNSGAVWCAGDNFYGELGIADKLPRGIATQMETDLRFLSVVSHNGFACGISAADRKVYCWGHNNLGQRGTGSTVSGGVAEPELVVSGDTDPTEFNEAMFEELDYGAGHLCARDANGSIWCWGLNREGQVGMSTPAVVRSAFKVVLPQPAQQLTLGSYHTCALLADGTVSCWGRNWDGQLGRDSTVSGGPESVIGLSNISQISADGSVSCAVRTDRSLWCWGADDDGHILGDGSDVLVPRYLDEAGDIDEVSVGNDVIYARQDESWFVWGRNHFGQFGNAEEDTAPNRTPQEMTWLPAGTTDVVAGFRASCAIADGDLFCWGDNREGGTGRSDTVVRTVPITVTDGTSPISDFVEVAAGPLGTCARRDAGSAFAVHCWGINGSSRALGNPSQPANWATAIPIEVARDASLTTSLVEAGNGSACLVDNGELYCWGLNLSQTFGDGPGGSPSSPIQYTLGGWTSVDELAMGHAFACGRSGTEVKCWGRRTLGQTGTGANSSPASPPATGLLAPDGLTTMSASSVETSTNMACAVETAGTLACWGWGYMGAGNVQETATPTHVLDPTGTAALTGVRSVGVGFEHACAVVGAEGRVYCWGKNFRGQSGEGPASPLLPNDTGVVGAEQVIAGHKFSCARMTSGQVQCWGANDFGQLGRGTITLREFTPAPVMGIDDAVDITVGATTGDKRYFATHVCALRASGEVSCWGGNLYGRLGGGEPQRYTSPDRVLGLP